MTRKNNKDSKQQLPDLGGKDVSMLAQQYQEQLIRSLASKSASYLQSLPTEVHCRIRAMKYLHSQRMLLEKEFDREISEIVKKYETKYLPLITRRRDLVDGVAEPNTEELVVEENIPVMKTDETLSTEGKSEHQNVKGVPEFWFRVLSHHEDFGAMITEADAEALKHLTDIRVVPANNHSPESFTLEFHFNNNEFFEDSVLKKTYILKEGVEGEVINEKVECTDINWKPNKNLTVKKVTKQLTKKVVARGNAGKQQVKGTTAQKQTITIEKPTESFFYFFKPESAYQVYGGMEEELQNGALREFLDLDYDLGMELKERVIPHAILFYTGENILKIEEENEENEEEIPPKLPHTQKETARTQAVK